MKKINKGVGKRIKGIRAARGLTQTQFGAIIEATQRYVGMMESGARRPSKGMIVMICSRFNEDEDWLCSGRKSVFTPEPNF